MVNGGLRPAVFFLGIAAFSDSARIGYNARRVPSFPSQNP
jgi:hypothetical protein